jgi:hypothetical protein
MKTETQFLRDARTFEERSKQLRNVVLVDRCLPEQVFHDQFHRFAFEEFDWAMSSEFWLCLQELAQVSCDTLVLMAVLDPDPKDYFLREFGYINWADIRTSMSASDYWNLLNAHPKDSPADSVLANSEKVVWLPHSGKWVVWGERSRGVCVLAARNRGLLEGISCGSWRNADKALNGFLANSFKDRVVPSGFAETFLFNFLSHSDLHS